MSKKNKKPEHKPKDKQLCETTKETTPEKEDEAKTISIQELLQEELHKVKGQLKESQNKYLQALAELENTRKRLQKETQERTKFVLQEFIIDFLAPLEQLDKALFFAEKMSEDIKNWAIGFKMIAQQFKDLMAEKGVKKFSSKGQTFDPHKHEALELIETEEHPDGTILEECAQGYMMGDKIILPAKVKVAKPIKSKVSGTDPKNIDQEETSKK